MTKSRPIVTLAALFLVAIGSGSLATPASAQSLLDKLKQATHKIEQGAQVIQQTAKPASQGAHGKNCGALGAGCLDYMNTVTDCLAPLKGYHAKMWADVIDARLQSAQHISAAQRRNLEEDLAAYRAAQANHTDTVDSRISGRMFEDLPRDDQIEANSRYGAYYNEIMSKCNGADHMQVGHTTELDYLKH